MAEEERRRIPPETPPSTTPSSRTSANPTAGVAPPTTRSTERIPVEPKEKESKERIARPDRIEHVRRPAGLPAAIKRISWGAIIAGAILAAMTQLVLSLLGISIGLGTLDPTTEADPLSGLATGAGIWLAVTTLLSLLAGGFAAARLAGLPKRTDGVLHGLVTWGVVTLLAFYLTTTAVGRLLSGAVGVVGQGLEMVSQGVAAAAPEVAQAVGLSPQERQAAMDEAMQEIQDEVAQLIQQPEPSQPAPAVPDTAQGGLGQFGQGVPPPSQEEPVPSPEEAEEEVRNALDRLRSEDGQPASQAVRGAIISVLAENTSLSEAEARQRVGQYEQRLQEAGQDVEQTVQETVQEEGPQVADDAAAKLSTAALWGFIALVLGALAAAGGGALGAPRDLLVSPVVSRDDVP